MPFTAGAWPGQALVRQCARLSQQQVMHDLRWTHLLLHVSSCWLEPRRPRTSLSSLSRSLSNAAVSKGRSAAMLGAIRRGLAPQRLPERSEAVGAQMLLRSCCSDCHRRMAQLGAHREGVQLRDRAKSYRGYFIITQAEFNHNHVRSEGAVARMGTGNRWRVSAELNYVGGPQW